MLMSALAHYFMDVRTEKKGNEVVDNEDNDVGSSGCIFQSPHLASVVLNMCVLFEGVCWRVLTLNS